MSTNDSAKESQGRVLRSILFDGLLLTALGVVVIIWPETALKIFCIISGAVIAAMGLIRCIVFFVNKNGDHTAWDLILGIIQIALGVVLIIARESIIKSFFILSGILLLYGALMMIIQGIMLRKDKKALVACIIFAVIMIALGVIVLINPASFAKFVTRLQGASLVVEGIGMIIVAFIARSKQKKIAAAVESVQETAED